MVPTEQLRCVIAEVHNTYGERHCYLLHPDEAGRARTEKGFFVSPFNEVDGSYRMSLPEPGEHLPSPWCWSVPGGSPSPPP